MQVCPLSWILGWKADLHRKKVWRVPRSVQAVAASVDEDTEPSINLIGTLQQKGALLRNV